MFGASLLSLLAVSSTFVESSLAASRQDASWPATPFITQGRNIANSNGENVVYAGVNWPGASEVMIPEGLQYQSVQNIVSKIKSIGLNSIRLTYAIELVDQIYSNDGQDVPIQKAFVEALGEGNGTRVFNQVMAANPSFTEETTRLEVYDAIAEECANQEIMVHLDNHVSKAQWCCSATDGNAWFGDTYFSVANWTRGLSYMAKHGQNWTSLVSMSLRNELREPDDNTTLTETSYNWENWYANVQKGTKAIHSSNSDVLIFLSGLNFDTFLTPVVQGSALTPGNGTFDFDDFAGYTDKLVLELHNYASDATDCGSLETSLATDGFQAMDTGNSTTKNVFPVVLTEFGFEQDATTWKGVYATCIATYMSSLKAGWMQWALGGSYYIREGYLDLDETWGLLSHNWSDWRSPEYIQGGLIPLINNTASP